MRQQVRLNVLIPVAVLGLLGAGFGAWAMGGGSPSSVPAPAPAVTTTGAAPAAPTPPKPKPGTVTPDVWSAGANAVCQTAEIESEPPGTPMARKALLASLASVNEFFKTLNAELASLGMPQGERARVQELKALNARAAGAFRRAHAALRRNDVAGAQRIFRAAEGGLGSPVKLYRRLGAELCGDDAKDYLEIARASESLTWLLLRHQTVVVLFYTPGATVDTKAVVEARAAAGEAGAGFVAVNVKREEDVAALAVDYEVLDTPTVLVFTRGGKLRTHLTGPVDRTTVAQAVTNARR
jgi:hypothetical protein